MKKNILFSLASAIVALLTIGCSVEPAVEISMHLPQASFTYEVNELAVQFTDTSMNATTYAWDFGDGETSTDQSPLHTYSVEGRYTVILVATDSQDRTSTYSTSVSAGIAVEEVEISVDGDFSDWDAVPASMLASVTFDESTNTSYTALKEVKMCANADYIYAYIKFDAEFAHELSFYINSDNDDTTGYSTSWMWSDVRADYRIVGTYSDNFDMGVYPYDPTVTDGGWSGWLSAAPSTGAFTISNIVDVSGTIKEFEGYIIRDYMSGLGVTISVGINLGNSSWSTIGRLPATSDDAAEKSAGLSVVIP